MRLEAEKCWEMELQSQGATLEECMYKALMFALGR
jgi:hypothetical protein